ncbi:MAG TPA: lipoyl(octanoyl) transferase LipB [Gemmatimonadales bacterium]|nr:lipoyl(octanoyl) transferase LipB [Gemmatimonadales bacterium]
MTEERTIEVIEAGVVPYADALDWQRQLAEDRIARRLEHDVLLLLEHPPVVTLGRNSHAAHLLRPAGVDVFEVERGGDVTFHGPGQLVGYPILDLSARPYKQDLHWYLRTLEQALIESLGILDIPAARNPGFTGVWTRGKKIASIGIHVKQWVTWHGFALNVATDLTYFDRIVPCGIQGVEMTSVERETGNGKRETLWEESVGAVIQGFQRVFGVSLIPCPEGPARRGHESLRTRVVAEPGLQPTD